MDKLKPCPFCGSWNVELRAGIVMNGAVHCNNCTADVVFSADELEKGIDPDWLTATVENWNRRVIG